MIKYPHTYVNRYNYVYKHLLPRISAKKNINLAAIWLYTMKKMIFEQRERGEYWQGEEDNAFEKLGGSSSHCIWKIQCLLWGSQQIRIVECNFFFFQSCYGLRKDLFAKVKTFILHKMNLSVSETGFQLQMKNNIVLIYIFNISYWKCKTTALVLYCLRSGKIGAIYFIYYFALKSVNQRHGKPNLC